MAESRTLTNDEIFQKLRDNGVTRVVLHNGEILLDYGEGEDSDTKTLESIMSFLSKQVNLDRLIHTPDKREIGRALLHLETYMALEQVRERYKTGRLKLPIELKAKRPKNRIVKEDVDRLYAQMLVNDPDKSLTDAMKFYATQKEDTFENVNRLYYYDPKKP